MSMGTHGLSKRDGYIGVTGESRQKEELLESSTWVEKWRCT